MLEKPHRTHQSSARFVGQFFDAPDSLPENDTTTNMTRFTCNLTFDNDKKTQPAKTPIKQNLTLTKPKRIFFKNSLTTAISAYFSIANLNAQNANTTVIGANIRFSKETPDARFPTVFKSRYAKITQTPIFTTFLNLPALM